MQRNLTSKIVLHYDEDPYYIQPQTLDPEVLEETGRQYLQERELLVNYQLLCGIGRKQEAFLRPIVTQQDVAHGFEAATTSLVCSTGADAGQLETTLQSLIDGVDELVSKLGHEAASPDMIRRLGLLGLSLITDQSPESNTLFVTEHEAVEETGSLVWLQGLSAQRTAENSVAMTSYQLGFGLAVLALRIGRDYIPKYIGTIPCSEEEWKSDFTKHIAPDS